MLTRNSVLTIASLTALAMGMMAFPASQAVAQGASGQNNSETVVVSASRITASGFAAPTPTTVLGTKEIEQNAQPNLFNTITQLPSLQGSTGTQSGTGNTSNGTNGLSSFNQRALGTIRSLTLIDSQRVVAANVTGVNDVSLFPQLLIQRVDIVSGGASASWGSDAVGGVVNFVTNKNFNGFKANVQGGISNYNDDAQGVFQVAAGSSLFGGRGHIEAAAEFFHNDGIAGANMVGGVLPGGRCCAYNSGNLNYTVTTTPQIDPNTGKIAVGTSVTTNIGTVASPVNVTYYTRSPTSSTVIPCGQIIHASGTTAAPDSATLLTSNCLTQNNRSVNTVTKTTSEYGLITAVSPNSTAAANALVGLAVNADATTVSKFTFGTPISAIFQVPNTVPGTAAFCGSISSCVGGDLTNNTQKTSIDDPITRGVFFARGSYDLTPDINVYGTYMFGNVWTENTPGSTANAAITLQCGNATNGPNAYLPASVQTACLANNVTALTVGASYDKFPQIKMSVLRQMRRYVAGATGDFDFLGTKWNFDTYFEHGENSTSIHITHILLNPHYLQGMDAVQVTAANQANLTPAGFSAPQIGAIVCRSTTAQVAGCLPYDILGAAAPAANVMAWLEPANGPYQLSHQRQEAAAVTFNGVPFKLWAGEVATAFGFEYREEDYAVVGDPYSNGITPNSAAYPVDGTLAVNNNWRAGNFYNGQGNYHVIEGFLEVNLPLLRSEDFGNVDLNMAGRETNYTTSGYVSTWKLGGIWETPLPGFKLRAMLSRDVRAPNLDELFKATIVQNGNGLTDNGPNGAGPVRTNIQYNSIQIGNPNLKPEKANNTQLGFVYQPEFIPGLNLSADYYRVSLTGQIAPFTAQQIVDQCQIYKVTSYCSLFFLNGIQGTQNPNFVTIQVFNLASTVTDGFDVEVAYAFDLQDWDVPGSFIARGLATHVSKFIQNTGVPNAAINEFAGQVGNNGTPLWKLNLSQSWRTDTISLSFTERYFSNGVLNPYGIVCAPGSCPLSTAQNPTYAAMNVPGNLFLDVGGTYEISNSMEAYFKVDNVGDRLVGPIAGSGDNSIGRVYRFGFRINN